jgi:hypothetical protein
LQLEDRSRKMVLRGFPTQFVDREVRNYCTVKFRYAVPHEEKIGWAYARVMMHDIAMLRIYS